MAGNAVEMGAGWNDMILVWKIRWGAETHPFLE
jgi:hypothetical protein